MKREQREKNDSIQKPLLKILKTDMTEKKSRNTGHQNWKNCFKRMI